MAKTTKAVEIDERKWQAERIVKEAFEKTPAFKRAVRETIQMLKSQEGNIAKQLKKK